METLIKRLETINATTQTKLTKILSEHDCLSVDAEEIFELSLLEWGDLEDYYKMHKLYYEVPTYEEREIIANCLVTIYDLYAALKEIVIDFNYRG